MIRLFIVPEHEFDLGKKMLNLRRCRIEHLCQLQRVTEKVVAGLPKLAIELFLAFGIILVVFLGKLVGAVDPGLDEIDELRTEFGVLSAQRSTVSSTPATATPLLSTAWHHILSSDHP